MVWRKQPEEVLSLLREEVPANLASTEIAEQRKLMQGMAHRAAQRFREAESAFDEAEKLAANLSPSVQCRLLIAKGGLEIDEREFARAEAHYKRALLLARQEKLSLIELNVLTAMGTLAPNEEHFDQAIDINRSALNLSYSLKSQGYTATILGNMAWSYSELGDFESALDFFKQGAEASQRSGLPVLAAYWLTGIANSQIALHDFAAADSLAQKTLVQARKYKNAQTIAECLNILTKTALQAGRRDDAEKYNQEALALQRAGGDTFGVHDSLIQAGKIARAKRDFSSAQNFFHQVLGDTSADTQRKWEAQAGLAAVFDDAGNPDAESLYKQAIATIEAARSSVEHEDLRMSFLSSGIAVYGQYIDFLIRHGRAADALLLADQSRARTLAEGLSAKTVAQSPSAQRFNPQQLAQRLRATLLVYWLGEKQSYLWAVTSSKLECYKLPPAAEIDLLVKTYRDATLKSADLLTTAAETGKKLYTTLVEPAQSQIPANSRVIVFPDGSLNGLNFETLIVPQPAPHFWIEDVTSTTGNSLSMLSAALNRPRSASRNVLLVGDAVPVPEFGELPQAREELQKIGQRFPGKRQTVLQRDQATRDAYLSSHPDRYAYLHFVTHGTASRARPLDSAVILSKEPGTDIYKLYARDIVTHSLRAQLVTISACNGSGTRAYSGEGLVGLSWAFLRAGAHNVIGALWEVSDVSTPQLMDKMYAELAAGKDPATALRTAKLSLLHQKNVFAKPFYWAPFQLYSGS